MSSLRFVVRTVGIALGAGVALTGCSVDGIDLVFGRDGGGSSQGGHATTGGAPGTGGESVGPTTTDTTTTTSGPTTTTSGPTTTTTTTSGPTTTTVTSGPATTTGGPLGPSVYCNGGACADGEVCCYNQFQEGVDYCSQAGQCPNQQGWIEITCNGPDDCDSGVCCGHWNNQVGWFQVSCEPSCTQGLTMCFSDPGICDNGTMCTPSSGLGQGYSYCGN